MKSRNIVGITLIFFILGCRPTEAIKPGKYEIAPISRFEMGFRYIFQDVRGVLCNTRSLTLKADSSFELLNYPFESVGYWRYINDSLVLFLSDSQWIDDSLKERYPTDKTPIISLQPISFQVRDEYLIRSMTVMKNKKAIVKLKFKEP